MGEGVGISGGTRADIVHEAATEEEDERGVEAITKGAYDTEKHE